MLSCKYLSSLLILPKIDAIVNNRNDKKGTDAEITVADRAGIDKLYLTNVQGENFTTNKLLIFYSDAANGIINNVGTAATAITSSALTSDLYSGNIVQVNNYNHGMTSDNNKVTLSGIQPDGIPTTLSANLSNTDTVISVANTSVFGTFEGITTSTGYAQVGQEIIYYNGIGAGTLNVGTRGFSDTSVSSHSSGDSIFKYEYNGISLTGINTTHSMATAAGVKALKTIVGVGCSEQERGSLANKTRVSVELSTEDLGTHALLKDPK